ncbi:hypothetical protein ABVT39_012400 [Epinephelus coioides]
MVPLGRTPTYASRHGRFLVRLKYIGTGELPTRDYVGDELLFDSCWINTSDVYSFIALPNKRDFELIFLQEAPMRRFLDVYSTKQGEPKWREWMVESAIQLDIVNLVVKFWTGRVPDNDVELYLSRFCDILQVNKPLDKHGICDQLQSGSTNQQHRGSSAQQQPGSTLQPQPGPTLQPQPGPTLQPQPGPTLQQQPGSTLQPQPGPTLQQQPGSTHQQQPGPTLQPQPGPSLQQQPGPTLQQRPGPSLKQQPSSTLQQQPGPAQLQCGSGDQRQPEPCDQQLKQTCPSDQQQHQQPTFQQPLHLSPAKRQQQRMQLGPGENPSAVHQHRRQHIPAPEPANHPRHRSQPPAREQQQQQQQQQQRGSDPGGQLQQVLTQPAQHQQPRPKPVNQQQHSAPQSAATLQPPPDESPSSSGENSTGLVIDTDIDAEESSDESSFESASESPSSEFSDLLTPGQRVSSTPLQLPSAETPAVSNSGSFSTTPDFPDPTREGDAPYQGHGLVFNLNYGSVMYGLLEDTMPARKKELFELIISIVCVKLWKTRCVMIIKQTVIDCDMVVNQVLTDLRRRKTLDRAQSLPWNLLDLEPPD